MDIVQRSGLLRERLSSSKFAERADEIMQVASGKEAMRVGMPVEVTQRSEALKTAPNGRSFHVRIAASTEAVARDSGIIPISAWEDGGLRNFVQNPIILAYHSHKEPIGRSNHTEIDGGKLVQYWEFHGESETSRLMQALYERGFMRAASVGFLVHDYRFIDELTEKEYEDLQKKYGAEVKDIYWIASRAELLETSAVPVPSDPKALQFGFESAIRNAQAIGMDISPVKSFLDRSISMTTPKKDEVVKGAEVAAPAAPAAPAAAPAAEKSVAEQITEAVKAATDTLRAEFNTRFEKLETAQKATPASTPAAEVVSDKDDRSVEIEMLPGETEQQAIERFVDAELAKHRGAPQPKVK